MATGFSMKTLKNVGTVRVDIDDARNCDVLFFPTETKLRSRIMPFRSGARPDSRLAQIQSIPGMQIEIDCEKRVGRIVDLLGKEENRRILENIKSALLTPGRENFSPQVVSGPEQDREYVLGPDEIVNWLFWMVRIVESGRGTVSSGRLPEKAEIVATERVRNVNLGGAPVAAYIKPIVDEEALASV